MREFAFVLIYLTCMHYCCRLLIALTIKILVYYSSNFIKIILYVLFNIKYNNNNGKYIGITLNLLLCSI